VNGPARPLVSLIVVNFNGAHVLPTFLEALAQTTYEPYELIVVDNASVDNSLAQLARSPIPATVVKNTVNEGFGRACNRAAEVAHGDFLVFLNPDVVVSPEWLEILVQRLLDDPQAGVISPQTLPHYMHRPPPGGTTEELPAVPGCALMVRRDAWRELEGFDETFFLYWEDTELCWRTWLLGWRVLADRQAYVHHDEGRSSGASRWDAEQLRNGLYTYIKLMPWPSVAAFVVISAGKTLVKLARRPQLALLEAWTWNLRHRRSTLAQRRRWAERRRVSPSVLAQRVSRHRGRDVREFIRHRHALRKSRGTGG
jgi:N-acetylglucosaminyl-diphospho-decaprenol L-rhamnosyltransferase